MNINQKILEVVKAYPTIIDFDEEKEVMHMLADISEVITELFGVEV